MNFNVELPGRPNKKTPPMNIPEKTQNTADSENDYESTLHFFDPSKKSPPNSWTNRLMSRFDQFATLGNSFGNTFGNSFVGTTFGTSLGNNFDNLIIK